jgi:cholesterol transport system auxiliary component
MKRRIMLTALVGVAGCSVLPSQPYVEKRDWPLAADRPTTLPPPQKGRVLLVRAVTAAPGLDRRGVQWLLPDGSLHIDYYEHWAVPPAQAAEESLRRWLAGSGLFAAVVGPGSRMNADLVLEGELTAFVGDPANGVARATLSVVLLDQKALTTTVMMQLSITGTAPLSSNRPQDVVGALRGALGSAMAQTEQAIARTIQARA